MSGISDFAPRDFVVAIERCARVCGFTGDHSQLAQWICNRLAVNALAVDDSAALLNAIATSLSFTGPIEQLPGFVLELVQGLKQGQFDCMKIAGKADAERDATVASLSALQAEMKPLREALDSANDREAKREDIEQALRSELEAGKQRESRLRAALDDASNELRILRRKA